MHFFDLLKQNFFMNSLQIFKTLNRVFPKQTSVYLTETLKEVILMKNNHLRATLLGKGRFDCDNILYKSNLTELRNELRTIRQTEHVTLKRDSTAILHKLTALNDELKEEMSMLKNELQIEMNSRKIELTEELNLLEMRTQEVNNKLDVLSSEVKTEIERMKVDVTSAIISRTVIALTILLFVYIKFIRKDKKSI